MKTTFVALALLIATAPLSRLHAEEFIAAPGQASVKKPVILSLKFEDVDLGSLASAIAKEGGVNILVSDDVAKEKVKKIALSNVSAEEALRAAADASNVEFSRLNDGTYSLKRKNLHPQVFAHWQKPYKLEFTIGNLLTQSIQVYERDIFSITARVGQHTYEIIGSNEMAAPDMMVTMHVSRITSDDKSSANTTTFRTTANTSTFTTNAKLQVTKSSESPAKAVQVGRIDVNKEPQIITVSVSDIK